MRWGWRFFLVAISACSSPRKAWQNESFFLFSPAQERPDEAIYMPARKEAFKPVFSNKIWQYKVIENSRRNFLMQRSRRRELQLLIDPIELEASSIEKAEFKRVFPFQKE